jgi:single-stranded-DNA-specific exonuclease
LTRDGDEAERLAEQLDRHNRERRAEEARVVDEARRRLAALPALPPIAVAWDAGWHRGVVGIAAGRIARELQRPAVLLAVEGGTATGSGRSVPGIALHDFLGRWRDRLERFGGHSQAIGLTVAAGALEALAAEWETAAAEWPAELLTRRHEYELELEPAEADARLVAELARLEPHGQGNPQPLVRVGPLQLLAPPRRFGKAQAHLGAVAGDGRGARLELLGWGWSERADLLAERFEALGCLEADRRHGGPVLRLIDARAV